MKALVLHLQLFSRPSPPTVCLGTIEVSQYVLLLGPVPFEETTNESFFKEAPSLAVYLRPDLQCRVIYVPSYRRCLSAALADAKKRGVGRCEEVVHHEDGASGEARRGTTFCAIYPSDKR